MMNRFIKYITQAALPVYFSIVHSLLVIMTAAIITVCPCSADEFTWTGGGGNGDWNNAANWMNTTPGGTETIPNGDDNVNFGSDVTTTDGFAFDFTNSAMLTNSGLITLSGTSLNNSGTLTFIPDNTNNVGNIPDRRFAIDSAMALTGGGMVLLAGTENGFIGSGTLTNVDNTIRGFGEIQVNLVNQHTIQIEGGVFTLGGGFALDNSGGVITLAAGSELNLGTSLLEGGSLASTLGSFQRGGTMKNVTLTGTMTERANNNTNWEGTITNQGTITFASDSSNNIGVVPDTRFTINTPVTLGGSGSVVLTGTETGLTGSGTLTNVDNTIRGFGQIQVAVNNQGTIRAEGGRLNFLDGFALDNTNGDVEIAADGILDLDTSSLSNGNLAATAGSLIAGGTLNNVTLSGTLTQAINRNTVLEGTITNQGTITFSDDSSNNIGGFPDTRFHLDTAVTLTGGGNVILTGSETGFAGDGTLSNIDNRIEAGTGAVLDVAVQNGATAVIAIGDGKHLQLNAPLSGGTLDSHAGGLISTGPNGGLGDLILTGTLTNQRHNALVLEGTITNQGVLTMEPDNSNNVGNIPDTRFVVDSSVILTGAGEVLLNGTETGFTGEGVLTNGNNTIRGFGQIQVTTINQGTIAVEGGKLSLESGIEIDNSTGSVTVAADGGLNLGSGTIRGGTIAAALGSTVRDGTLNGITLTGTLTEEIDKGTSLAGTIINQGRLTFAADGTNNIGGIPDTRFAINTQATLTGGGEVVLTGTETGLTGSGRLINADNTIRGFGQVQVELVNNGLLRAEGGRLLADRNLTGAGEIQIAAASEFEFNATLLTSHKISLDPAGTFDFNGARIEFDEFTGNFMHDTGDFSPAIGQGIAALTGDYTMSSNATLKIEIAGTSAGAFDVLQVSGDANVDGTLHLQATQQIATVGTSQTMDILTAGTLSGTFANMPTPGDHVGYGVFLDALNFDTAGDRVEITISQTLFPGDFDADGDVDADDLNNWQSGFGTSPGALLSNGDANADSDVDGDDFLIWQQNFGSGIVGASAGAGANAVPEPATLWLLGICFAAIGWIRRRIPQ